ncbi:MAG TPA: ATP-binding protein [Rectinemataceae bacterium]|nr:ATP-binding protein [Rectinemataceae bacterium]
MVPRTLGTWITELGRQFPVLALYGPRQSGKTTLCRSLFPDKPYVNLERPDIRERIVGDPGSFLRTYGESGVLIDEAQNFPELPSWLQAYVDEHPGPGRFILTGSNQSLLRAQVSQSLAGRAALIRLFPFTVDELLPVGQLRESTDDLLFKGFYPPLYDKPFRPSDWFSQYVQTYLERDLVQLARLKDWSAFHRFLLLCAGRTGQVLNLSSLARDADVSHTTARQWLSLLEAGFLVFLLQPWHENYRKRLVKSPKLYFYDVGLAGHLAGIREPAQWAAHPLRGAFFETMVVADLVKSSQAAAPDTEWFFWSSPSGLEVDLVERRGAEVRAHEIKSGATFRPEQLKNLLAWSALSGLPPENMILHYDGDEEFVYRGVRVRPWRLGRGGTS